MPSQYALTVETTSNATAGASGANCTIAALAPSGGELVVVAVLIDVQNTGGTMTPGRWVLDNISALGSGGSSATPGLLSVTGKAASGTAYTSTTLAVTPTVTTAAVIDLAPGWNYLLPFGIELRSGASRGWALRRATAPSGSQVVKTTLIYNEV